METLLTALRNIIKLVADPIKFPSNNIMYGFQTPTANNFISYHILNSRKTGITDVKIYDPVLETKTSVLLYENIIQVDCYSDDFFSSPDVANKLNQFLTAFASDYLRTNYPSITVGTIEDVNNLTDVGDKGKYTSRYAVRFSLFTHGEITTPQTYIDDVNVTPKWIS